MLYTASGGNNNVLFSTSNTIASLGPFSSGAFAGVAFGPGNTVNPYSLSLTTSITASATGVTTYSGVAHLSPTPVPEPATIGLVAGGLAAVLRRARKRRV